MCVIEFCKNFLNISCYCHLATLAGADDGDDDDVIENGGRTFNRASQNFPMCTLFISAYISCTPKKESAHRTATGAIQQPPQHNTCCCVYSNLFWYFPFKWVYSKWWISVRAATARARAVWDIWNEIYEQIVYCSIQYIHRICVKWRARTRTLPIERGFLYLGRLCAFVSTFYLWTAQTRIAGFNKFCEQRGKFQMEKGEESGVVLAAGVWHPFKSHSAVPSRILCGIHVRNIAA